MQIKQCFECLSGIYINANKEMLVVNFYPDASNPDTNPDAT